MHLNTLTCCSRANVRPSVCVLLCLSLVSQVKYHEEFERTRGRGAAHTLYEQHMTRLHGDHQMGGSEGYHGIQPQMLDTDRRSAATGQFMLCVCVWSLCWTLCRL